VSLENDQPAYVGPAFEGVDILDPDVHTDDPWPLYTWLREERPAHWDEANQLWTISRYDDVAWISKDPETFTSTEGNRPHLPPDSSFIHKDGPDHTRQRRLVSMKFTPSYVASLEPWIRGIVRERIDAVRADGRCEFVSAISAAVPMRVIAGKLGSPPEDDDKLMDWVDRFQRGGCGPQYVTDDVEEAFGEFAEWHYELKEKILARPEPEDDLLTHWLGVEQDGEPLDEDQILFDHTMVLVGGSETTRNVISAGLEVFSRQPDQWEALKADPAGLMPTAIEEIIRWSTPFISMCRTATRDAQVQGETIEEGQMIKLLYPAANRDPRIFERADEFDIRRPLDPPHIAFGLGTHLCLGMSLARLEIRVLLEELMRTLPDIRIDPDRPPVRRPSSFIRGFDSAHVVFTPA
jgi:cytochrome P450 family 142 subfamily A polypeptide 1